MIQVKYLALELCYPLPDTAVWRTSYFEGTISRHSIDYDVQMLKLHRQTRELEAVLWKCRGLQNFRLMLRTESAEKSRNEEGFWDYRALTADHHQDVESLVLVFLNAARCKHFKTAAAEHKTFLVSSRGEYESAEIESYRDPIVSWYNGCAEAMGILAHFEESHYERAHAMRFEHEADVPRDIHRYSSYQPDTKDGDWIEVSRTGAVLDNVQELNGSSGDKENIVEDSNQGIVEQEMSETQAEERTDGVESSPLTKTNDAPDEIYELQPAIHGNGRVEDQGHNLEADNGNKSEPMKSVHPPPKYRYFMEDGSSWKGLCKRGSRCCMESSPRVPEVLPAVLQQRRPPDPS